MAKNVSAGMPGHAWKILKFQYLKNRWSIWADFLHVYEKSWQEYDKNEILWFDTLEGSKWGMPKLARLCPKIFKLQNLKNGWSVWADFWHGDEKSLKKYDKFEILWFDPQILWFYSHNRVIMFSW